MKLGLVGKSISQSLSPAIFKSLAQRLNTPIDYQLYEISDPKEILKLAVDQSLDGLNITHPFKRSVIDTNPEIVNTYNLAIINTIKKKNNHWIATNTDHLGFEKIFSCLDSLNNVVLYGLGSTGLVATHVLSHLNLNQIIVVNRTYRENRFLEAQSMLKSHDHIYTEENFTLKNQFIDLLIHTSSEKENTATWIKEIIRNNQIKTIIDVNYQANQIESNLLQEASGIENKINGLSLLIYQALYAYEFWSEQKIDINFYYHQIYHELK